MRSRSLRSRSLGPSQGITRASEGSERYGEALGSGSRTSTGLVKRYEASC
jgi:hypothetical protein